MVYLPSPLLTSAFGAVPPEAVTKEGDVWLLGLDVGSLAIKAVFAKTDERFTVHGSRFTAFYRFHKGNPERTIVEIMKEAGILPTKVAVTGSGGRRIAEKLGVTYIDPAVALIAAAHHNDFGGQARHIIDIGGGSLSIVDLDEEGRFQNFRTNSLCAAGTGSFLDEQASRMGINDEERSKEFGIKTPPRIAARCAVFAKSDLIHRQQEGFTIPQMWSGLCKGMVTTAMATLFRGRKPKGPVILAGGVAKNLEVVRWLREEIEAELILPNDPHTFSANGAGAAAREPKKILNWSSLADNAQKGEEPRRPELKLTRSKYPSFECEKSYIDDTTEVRLHTELKGSVVIGIDIGSTSTKAAILDMDGKVVADLYRRTSGDPITATQKILAAIRNAVSPLPNPLPSAPLARSRQRRGQGERGHLGKIDLDIKGVGTTGSGRKMIGAIIGADKVINEITAHAKGAAMTEPDVETIFEIGGQDAKFIALREGVPHDSNMNYVCAAGTGSFVEEQAGKLGFKLQEIGNAVMGKTPPYSTDRCTVFMEQDIHALIRSGFDRSEVMGSVLYSVVQNYLNRVVGKRPYSRKKICFLGATARNKGLVAAFENLLNAEIHVSPFCHVMGAVGVANIVREEVLRATSDERRATKFRGLSFADEKITLNHELCELCPNTCRITRAGIGDSPLPNPLPQGERESETAPSWGYMCGRDPEEKRMRVSRGFDHFRRRDRLWKSSLDSKNSVHPPLDPLPSREGKKQTTRIGIPRSLLTFSNLPLWAKFFHELGAKIILSKPTNDETLLRASDYIGSDYCYPMKLTHGHILDLACDERVDFVFLPYIVQGEPHDDSFKRSVYCPYNIALPSIIKSAGLLENKPLCTAVVNFQLDKDIIVSELEKGIGKSLSVDKKQIARAWDEALKAQRSFEHGAEEIGKAALAKIEKEDGVGVVILGRPYNVCDLGANLNLPHKISDLGLDVLTVDMLPLSDVEVDPLFHNMYWKYGRKILQAAKFVREHPKLFAVYLTNFGCGPDSFLQTYVEKIMQGKPMLMLELDEHSADAGYVTRLEAFKDVVEKTVIRDSSFVVRNEKINSKKVPIRKGLSDRAVRANSIRTLWVPPMHPYGTSLLAAAIRSIGLPAKPLPTETIETFELARGLCRGTECVPLPSTIGAFLNVLKNSDAPEREAFFMPSAKGPCRFGQYHTLHRIILDDAGYKDSPIEAWSDETGDYCTGPKASSRLYTAIVTADLLFKARCRIRPYAIDRDGFDKIIAEELERAVDATEKCLNISKTLALTARRLQGVKRTSEKKPLIGIVGEIYVRQNFFTNGHLVETIEDAGGEAWVAPIMEWFQYLSYLDTMKSKDERHTFGMRLKKTIKSRYMMRKERSLSKALSSIIGDRQEPSVKSTIKAGTSVFPRQFDGESTLTIGRAMEFAQHGVDLIINCAPFGCMPGTLTSGILQQMETKLGTPVVSLFFDGETDLKHLVRTYLANIKSVNREP